MATVNYTVTGFAPGSVDVNGVPTSDFSALIANGNTLTLNATGHTQFQVTDNDLQMSGDAVTDERATDRGLQTTNVTGTAQRIYVDHAYTVEDGAGNQYTIYVFDVGESPAPTVSYIGYDATNPPPVGVPLTIVASTDTISDLAFANLVCFVAGTLIRTPAGERPVEALAAGDLVETLDSGAQPVLWAGSRRIEALDLLLRPSWSPVLVRAGAFGPGAPRRDTLVSPQHRILVEGPQPELLFGEHSVLAPAKGLVDGRDILWPRRGEGVTYVHLLLARHEILVANGMAAESLLLGEEARTSLDAGETDEAVAFFPALAADTPMAPARPLLRTREARLLAGSRAAVQARQHPAATESAARA